jgi:DNA-binding beta-propeller fold protein YncE
MSQILTKKDHLASQNYVLAILGRILGLLLLTIVIAGCVTGPRQSDQAAGEYIWPPPPEITRIKFIRQWYHKYDFGKPNKILDVLVGEERGIRLRRPTGVVSDSAGNVYAADSEHRVIFVFDRERNTLRFLGEGVLSAPVGLAVNNKKGILFVSDSRLDKVFGIDKNSGSVLMDLGIVGDFKNPSGLVYDENKNRLYVSDTKNHVVKVFDENGKPIMTIGKKGSEDGEFSYPSFLAVDKSGRLYVVDSFNFRVQIFDSEGRFIKKFGKLGDASGTFSRPAGIGVDSDGHVYVVDTAFNNFQIFSEEGKLLLWIGQGGGRPGEFSLPSGMYIDGNDMIYVADTFNRRIQVFQYLKEKK